MPQWPMTMPEERTGHPAGWPCSSLRVTVQRTGLPSFFPGPKAPDRPLGERASDRSADRPQEEPGSPHRFETLAPGHSLTAPPRSERRRSGRLR